MIHCILGFYIGIMETTIVHWGYNGLYRVYFELHRDNGQSVLRGSSTAKHRKGWRQLRRKSEETAS